MSTASALAGWACLCAFASVFAAAAPSNPTALAFPSNGETRDDVRFRFVGSALPPMYPATYIWRVNLRRQSGYYTTFFWGPDGAFTGTGYYGAHPYPDGEPKPSSQDHKWELSIDGGDFVDDANGHATQVEYGAWKIQALRAYDDGQQKVHEFFWDLPDTAKVIRQRLPRSYGATPPASPALTFGDAPWNQGNERLSGLLRGLQIYAASLPTAAIVAEAGAPLSTAPGQAGIWYLNSDPVPGDISDQSGRGHHPEWVSSARPALWTAALAPAPFALRPDRPGLRGRSGFRRLDVLGREAGRRPANGAMPLITTGSISITP